MNEQDVERLAEDIEREYAMAAAAGGIPAPLALARVLAARVAAARADGRESLAEEIRAWLDGGESEVASLIRSAALIQPFGPNARAVHDEGGAVHLTPAEAEAGARAVLTRLRALCAYHANRYGRGRCVRLPAIFNAIKGGLT